MNIWIWFGLAAAFTGVLVGLCIYFIEVLPNRRLCELRRKQPEQA